MQTYFQTLCQHLNAQLQGAEVWLANLRGEQSDFARFNHAKIRQAGHVQQYYLKLELINGQQHAFSRVSLTGDLAQDQVRLSRNVQQLRQQLTELPPDPYVLYATEGKSSCDVQASQLSPATEVVGELLSMVQGCDFVGIYTSGTIYQGFANSLGQQHWHQRDTFHLNWSMYLHADKAVKQNYAGFAWDAATFQAKIAQADTQLAVLRQTPRTLTPARYRVYLAPSALVELLNLIGNHGFGLKKHNTCQTPLLRMITEPKATLSPHIFLSEDTANGLAPSFQEQGFIRPASVSLIEAGHYQDTLISPRSAQEYQIATNGANEDEIPQSLSMAGGQLAESEILATLGTGIYINNLWYTNYSDLSGGRLTGMTRFACFWVENGEIVAPINVMRFDETLYHLLGDALEGLTTERELILDSSTYEFRSVDSLYLPGIVVDGVHFTL